MRYRAALMIEAAMFVVIAGFAAAPGRATVAIQETPCVKVTGADTLQHRIPLPIARWRSLTDSLRNEIRQRKVCVGMSDTTVRASWGLPLTIETTLGPDGRVDQFNYHAHTLIFENGRLTTIRLHAQGLELDTTHRATS